MFDAKPPTATDVIPRDLAARMGRLPRWALEKAIEIVWPVCPPPGVLYVLPAGRKLYLTLNIAEALVEERARR